MWMASVDLATRENILYVVGIMVDLINKGMQCFCGWNNGAVLQHKNNKCWAMARAEASQDVQVVSST